MLMPRWVPSMSQSCHCDHHAAGIANHFHLFSLLKEECGTPEKQTNYCPALMESCSASRMYPWVGGPPVSVTIQLS